MFDYVTNLTLHAKYGGRCKGSSDIILVY